MRLGLLVTGEALRRPLCSYVAPASPTVIMWTMAPTVKVHQKIIDRDVSYVSQAEWRQGRLLYFRGHSKEGHLQCGAHIIKTTFKDFIVIEATGFQCGAAIKVKQLVL